jgi:hypothetical protein
VAELSCGISHSGSTVGAPNTHVNLSGDNYFVLLVPNSGITRIDACGSSAEFVNNIILYLLDSNSEFLGISQSLTQCDDGTWAPYVERNLQSGIYSAILEGNGLAEGSYQVNMKCSCGDNPYLLRCSSFVHADKSVCNLPLFNDG